MNGLASFHIVFENHLGIKFSSSFNLWKFEVQLIMIGWAFWNPLEVLCMPYKLGATQFCNILITKICL